MKTILFICSGNTCRSPMAQCLCHYEDGVRALSAGLYAADGMPASHGAQRAMQRRELSLAQHRSQSITPELLQRVDAVIGMEPWHAVSFKQRFPDCTAPVLAFDDPPVSDPYGGNDDDYERAANDIIRQLPALLARFALPRVALCIPSEDDEADVLDYQREFDEHGDSMDGTAGLQKHLKNAEGYAAWLHNVRANCNEATVLPGLVPATTMLARDPASGRLVGMIDIRHRLNDHLLLYGGHIGYSVRPSCRRRGYATRMLMLALRRCRAMGLERVLVTCDKNNIASARTIMACGGILENEVPEGNSITQRYWIGL